MIISDEEFQQLMLMLLETVEIYSDDAVVTVSLRRILEEHQEMIWRYVREAMYGVDDE